MLADQELIEIHARVLYTYDGHSRIVSVNEPGGGPPAPRMFLGRTRSGNVWRFRHDLPIKLISELERLCADEPLVSDLQEEPRHLSEYLRSLQAHDRVSGIGAGPAYCFAEYPEPTRSIYALTEDDASILSGGFEDCVAELPDWQPFVAAIESSQAVSICRSVRITKEVHEAGVETLPGYRGKGLAVDVTAHWARLVRAKGAIPLYSTSWENTASQSVARKLGLRMFGTDLSIK